MKKIVALLAYTLYISTVVQSQEATTPDIDDLFDPPQWVEIAKTSRAIYSYKPSEIRPIGGIVKVWIKEKPANEAQRRAAADRKAAPYKSMDRDYSNYSHSLVLWNFDCSQRLMRLLTFIDYTSTGNVIVSAKLKERTWSDVAPESLGEQFFKVVCQ